MLHKMLAILAFIMMFVSCSNQYVDTGYSDDTVDYGSGGATPNLSLPFPSGKWWVLTQGYNTGTHKDWGFKYGDDRYALDFTQNGCDAYGEPITPVMSGCVVKITHDGDGDQGYGNSVIIDHGSGYLSRYGHLSEIYVDFGQCVSMFDYIGAVGDTGYCIGSACSSHPGTHLHLAFYQEVNYWPVSIPPEPMSGITDFYTGCWYNREGEESCGGDPGEYDPMDEYTDDEGNVNVISSNINPSWGTAGETEFVWTAVVDSHDAQPNATLRITNTNDNHTYDFPMQIISSGNPWVFTYRKTLRDPIQYTYWVEAGNGDGNDRSNSSNVSVQSSRNQTPNIYRFNWTPRSGNAGDTEFEWEVSLVSNGDPDITLQILNPNDGHVYDFPMQRRGDNHWWSAEYEKTLNDATTYPFWVTVDNGYTATTSNVGTIRTR